MDDHKKAVTFVESFLNRPFLDIGDPNFKKLITSDVVLLRIRDGLEAAALDPGRSVMEFDALMSFAAGLLRDHGSLPDWLAAFVADVLQGKQTRPANKRGANKWKNVARDRALCYAILAVAREYGVPLYSNNELSNKATAAAVVAEAAGLSVDAVIKVFKNRPYAGGK